MPVDTKPNLVKLTVILLLASATAAQEQGASWVEVDIRTNWQQTSTGFCRETTQCLVSNAFSEVFDNIPDSYWDGLTEPDLGPKCINNTQYILDNYCDNGLWSSRTRLVATQLLGLALNTSPTNFSLYCDTYESALNDYRYSVQVGPVINLLGKFCPQTGFAGASVIEGCVNNACVLRYGNSIAFGTSLNSPIDGSRSFLTALNLESNECSNAINDDGDYDYCGDAAWHNWNTNSLIYAPGASALPDPAELAKDFFLTPYNKLKDYVFSVVHKPDLQQFNYSFFKTTPQFTHVYLAKDNFDFAYSFKQKNVTLTQLDYAGWYFSNIDLPPDACTRIVKRHDSKANCEKQPSTTEFFIAAHKNPPLVRIGQPPPSIVDAWSETTGKLRVTP